jgi:hypothetical protein
VSPKLRKLVPDEELFRRRAGGEPLRDLAPDYGVCHTTLGRFFARPEVARALRRVERLIRTERREAAAVRRAEERASRTAQRQRKPQPAQASSATEPPPTAGEARPAHPDAGRPLRTPPSVALPSTAEPLPVRQGFAGFLDRKDADRAARVGRAPGQPANNPLEPREWLLHQVQLAKLNRDPEREAAARQALADWDAK